MPRISVRKELWVTNPKASNDTNKTSKKITCSTSPVSRKEGSRRWDQESFKKFKEKPEYLEDKPDLKVEKMPAGRSIPKEEEEEVIYVSSDSSVDMVLTDMEMEPPEAEVKPKVRKRGRPRKVPGEKSEKNQKSKKKKSQVNTKLNIQVEKKNHLSSKYDGAETFQQEDTCKNQENEEEREEFEKSFKHDINFVLAKYVVDKKMAFDIDKNKKITGFKKKMIEAIRREDILTLRKSLEGAKVHAPKDVQIPSEPAPAGRKAPSPVTLSNENSPDASFEWIIDEDVAQMPILSFGEKEPRKSAPGSGEKSSVKTKKGNEKVKSKVKVPLKPLNFFQSTKTRSFKIPRSSKTETDKATKEKVTKEKVPSWVVNGALWRWALAVDDNGQTSRVEKKVEKVPWAKKVQSRPCEEFQAWLVRGNFQEGDNFDWAEAIRKEKVLEKWRRRGDFEREVKITEHLLGRAKPRAAGPTVAPESPYWSEEEEELGWSSPEQGEREEWGSDPGSDGSGHSVVTHIRTPPRISMVEDSKEEQQPEVTMRTPERVDERLVNKIPTPPPSIAPRTLSLTLGCGETGSLGLRSRVGEQSQGELSSLVRRQAKRFKLC